MTKTITVMLRHAHLLPDGYTLVSVSSSSGKVWRNQFPSGL